MRIKIIKVMIDGKETEVAVMKDGKPVFVDDSGADVAVDVPHMFSKITALNKESQTHRETAEAAQAQLTKFAEITDPAAAAAALKMVANLDSKKLIDAGEADKVRQQIESVYKEQIAKLTTGHEKTIGEKDAHIYRLEVSNRFASSPFITGENAKIILPPDIAEATFGKNFKIEDGRMVAYLGTEKIFSREKAGELADFEEAIQVIVDAYPMKDRILKGANARGNGTKQTDQNGKAIVNDNQSSTQKIAAGLKELGGVV